ncbi:hypothetical protein COLO4_07449 [Corchorus olitorius]|uniref:Uncharacterized protein n=1 Tax=Corchorus olitorius TaxID=93759 RepID=A0A1R3KJQ2_9ROSI|nr:hypothetical protein COLO4_07449 [Corchorus olitorius]
MCPCGKVRLEGKVYCTKCIGVLCITVFESLRNLFILEGIELDM